MEKANLVLLGEVFETVNARLSGTCWHGLTELDASCKVANRGGLLVTVGITYPVAERCDSVMDPSELAHIITIGVFGIARPKPLMIFGWPRRGLGD